MFKFEKQKKRILILLKLNKENLSTKLSAILAPHGIKSSDFLKRFVLELKNLYNAWIGHELDIFLNEGVSIISNIELIIPVEVFLISNDLYHLNIKLPNWGFLFSYSLFFKHKFFYLYAYKSLFIKGLINNVGSPIILIDTYFLTRCSFFKSFSLML